MNASLSECEDRYRCVENVSGVFKLWLFIETVIEWFIGSIEVGQGQFIHVVGLNKERVKIPVLVVLFGEILGLCDE